MLNKCKTEYTYESCARSGQLPPEGFRESALSLLPVLEDPEFKSLIQESKNAKFTVFDVLGTSDYEIRHSNVLSWLVDRNGSHGQDTSFLNLLWERITDVHKCPSLQFREYSVVREGKNESEKIDLFIKAEDLDWVIVIENKLFSPETGNQLERYFKYIENRYSKVPRRFYLYLTPDGIVPINDEDSRNWLPVSYATITQVISQFLGSNLSERVKSLLEQYLEHIQKNVLKSTDLIERQRGILNRHAKVFHSLTYMLDEECIHSQCGDMELNLLKSILAGQSEVGLELFEFTKQMMAKHGYSRYSGLGYWITIELPGLRERLIQAGFMKTKESLPILFSFASRPNSYAVNVSIYKNKWLYSKLKGQLSRFSSESPESNRGDEHLVDFWFYKTIISSEQNRSREPCRIEEQNCRLLRLRFEK